MAAPVVYEGAVRGGTLFDGMKFWVAQRIPMRTTFIEMITSNGGQIVLLEKLADVMIADHARKEAPPGSYSWKFIAESVKLGRLEKLEDHPAGPPVGTIRPVGSSRPPKGTRSAFTDEDDRLLAQWVQEAERRGLSSKGNSIYQQLENKNLRHTFQSWRDRWIKYGQFQERADITQFDGDDGPSRRPRPSGSIRKHSAVTGQDGASVSRSQLSIPSRSKQSPRRVRTSANVGASLVNSVRRPQVLHEAPKPPPSTKKPLKSQPFTEGDRDILLGIYNDILNIDEEKLFEAWEAFADANPQHTAQDWYKFWMKDVKPLGAPQREEAVNYRPPDLPPKVQTGPSSAVEESAKTFLGHEIVYPDAGPPDPHRLRLGPPYLDEARFENIFKIFCEGQHLQIDLKTVVSGQEIRLFDLWQIVNGPELGGYNDVNTAGKWGDVARELGFNKFKHPDAPSELEATYDLLLGNLSDALALWRPKWKKLLEGVDSLRMTEEEILHYQEVTQRVENADLKWKSLKKGESAATFDDSLVIPSSPPPRLWSSGKRGHQVADVPKDRRKHLQTPLATPNRRQRADKGKGRLLEIPSTPEDLLRFQGQVRGGRSSSADQDVTHEDEDELHRDEEDIMSINNSQRKLSEMSNLKTTPKTVNVEPETQEFHFSHRPHRKASKTISPEPQAKIPGLHDTMGALKRSSLGDSSTQPHTDSQRGDLEVQAFVDHHVSLGYPEEIVRQALLATTMETGDVATVMESMMQGDGIPVNIEGVWTEEDDLAARLPQDDERYQRLRVKHKEKRCVKRRRFLSDEALKRAKWSRYRNLARCSALWGK